MICIRTLVPVLLACVLSMGVAGCDRAAPARETTVAPFSHRFTIKVGDVPVQMRVAVLEHETSRGLMHMASMPEDEGMLFIFARPRRMSFYMRNTSIPLDIGYFSSAGYLREIFPLHPFVEDSVPSTTSDMQYALEMNQGWYARHGVRPGAMLDMEAVREALRRRGFEPTDYLPRR